MLPLRFACFFAEVDAMETEKDRLREEKRIAASRKRQEGQRSHHTSQSPCWWLSILPWYFVMLFWICTNYIISYKVLSLTLVFGASPCLDESKGKACKESYLIKLKFMFTLRVGKSGKMRW